MSNETLAGASANRQDGARLDIAASGFWGGTFERTFFDVIGCLTPTPHRTDTLNSRPVTESMNR